MPDAPVVYIRRANYYETDQMGVVHHANYPHWFEEARVDFMDRIGVSYRSCEEKGISSPVLSMNMEFKSPVRFGESVSIAVGLEEIGKARMKIRYLVSDSESGELRCTGCSTHCWVNEQGRPVLLRKTHPDIYEAFVAAMEINREIFPNA